MKRTCRYLLAALLSAPLGLPVAHATGPVKVEIIETGDGYQLLRGGQPYDIKGACLHSGDLEAFARHGGNSIRNWSTEGAQALLDRAQALGVTVALGLPVEPERHGFNYDDKQAVAEQRLRLREEVMKYRDHPALLAWIIGNELNLEYTQASVYDAVNDISRMIHELDPNHPTTTTVAGLNKRVLREMRERAPDLDFYSFQVYAQLAELPEFIRPGGLGKPLMITEWGPVGHWEVERTPWDAPIEMTSSGKARMYLDYPPSYLEPVSGQVIGSYVFLWGWKQEKTPTWYGMFTETGEETAVVDVMHYHWNGAWPGNRAPAIQPIRLDGKVIGDHVRLQPGASYAATVEATDPDGDALGYRWELKPESTAQQVGGDHEAAIDNLEGLIADPALASITLTAPAEPGAYRLFVYAYDGHNHAAHANFPFYVSAD